MLDSRQKKSIIILMSLMMLLCVASSDIYLSSLPQMVKEFNTTDTMVNLTISISSLGIALSVLFVGELSNRFGRKSTLIYGIISFSITSLLISLVPSIDIIILLRFVQAIGCAIILIVTRLVLKDSMNEQEQINANGYLLIALVISPALAPVVGAILAKYFGWRSCFVVSALSGFILAYYTYKILPETNNNKIVRFKPILHYLGIYQALLTDRKFLTLTTIYSSAIGAYFSFIGISSYLYIDYWHLKPINYSYIFISLSLAYLLGNKIMSRLNKLNIDAKQIINYGVYSTVFGVVLLIISSILFNGIGLIIMISISVLFMRIANAIINPPTQIRIMTMYNTYSAQSLGLNICISFCVSGFATTIVTLVPFNPLYSLVFTSSLFVLICFMAYRFNQDRI